MGFLELLAFMCGICTALDTSLRALILKNVLNGCIHLIKTFKIDLYKITVLHWSMQEEDEVSFTMIRGYFRSLQKAKNPSSASRLAFLGNRMW